MHPLPARPRDAICPNCAAAISAGDHYCYACGQKTRYRPRTLRGMLQDVAGRDFTPDGRLGLTLKTLLVPGQLTVDWFAGRQQRYLGPVRLLLLTMLVLVFVLQFIARQNMPIEVPEAGSAAPVWSRSFGTDYGRALLHLEYPHTRLEVRAGVLAPLLAPFAAQVQARLAGMTERELLARLQLRVIPIHSYGLLLVVPLVIGLLALAYAGTARRLAEHTVFVLHWCSFGLLTVLCLQLPLTLLLRRTDWPEIIYTIVVTLWFARGMQNYYRGRPWINLLRVVGVATLTWLILPYIDALVALYALG